MKLSEMTPETNQLHAYFRDASTIFMKSELWKDLTGIAMGYTHGDTDSEFRFLKIVKNKIQIFRYFGDVVQSDKSTDPQTYAAPEGHVEIEIRPERLDGVKIPRPRCNIYVPNMNPKEFEDTYTKRDASDSELQQLLTAVFSVVEIHKQFGKGINKASDWSIIDPKYEPFDISVEVPDVSKSKEMISVRLVYPLVTSDNDRRCSFCSRKRTEMSRCSGCKVAFYCCSDHQVLDWKSGHKAACLEARKSSSLTLELSFPVLGEGFDYENLPWFILDKDIDDFHNINTTSVLDSSVFQQPMWNVDHPKPNFNNPVKLMQSRSTKLSNWEELYAMLSLSNDSPYASVLDQVMTLYSVLYDMRYNKDSKANKATTTIHIPDSCLEPAVIETFGLLLSLLPNYGNIRIVICGRRLPKSLHYAVFSWSDANTMNTIDQSSGKVGDVWRGQVDQPLAIRVFAADHSTMTGQEVCLFSEILFFFFFLSLFNLIIFFHYIKKNKTGLRWDCSFKLFSSSTLVLVFNNSQLCKGDH